MTPTEPPPETVTANFKITWHSVTLEAAAAVPTGPTRPRVILPVIQKIANALVGMAEQVATASGAQVSCKVGCAACCRQLVPVSETEARHLRDLVEALPQPRRAAVRQRFADTVSRLAATGLLDRLQDPAEATKSLDFARDYFAAGIPCPFLEDESCSIYPDRPLACREHLVVSPAENCRRPVDGRVGGKVIRLPIPGSTNAAFGSLDGPPTGNVRYPWVALPLAPAWADANPEPPATETGTALFSKFITILTTCERGNTAFWQQESATKEKA